MFLWVCQENENCCRFSFLVFSSYFRVGVFFCIFCNFIYFAKSPNCDAVPTPIFWHCLLIQNVIFSWCFACDAICANRAPVWVPARFFMFRGCLPGSSLVHNLRCHIGSFFVIFVCSVFDILGVSSCSFGAAVAPWAAFGPPPHAPPWESVWFFGLSKIVSLSVDFLYNFLAFRGFLLMTQNVIFVVAFPVVCEDGPHALELSGPSCN